MKRHALMMMAMALLLASRPGPSAAADAPQGGSPASNRVGTFSISPVVGGVSFDGEQHLETAPVFGLRAGYNFTRNLEAEALFDYSKTRSTLTDNNTDFLRYGADLLWNFRPDEKFVPNVAAGYAGTQLKSQTKGAFDLGAGFKYFVTEDMAWRGDVRGIFLDNKIDRYAIEYTTGIYIPFGVTPPVAKLPAPPPPPEPVARPLPAAQPTLNLTVPPPVVPVPVAAPEVSLAAAPASIKKGEKSVLTWQSKRADNCEMRPDVGDVAANGSTIVTPAADTIYTVTCKGKGGTASANAAVMVVQPTQAEKRFCNQPAVLMINFDTDKWNVKPQYHAELKTVGDFLNEFPEAHGEISGHTDGTASVPYNQRLSERRAQSVRDYIVKNFNIDPKRLTAKGYGKSRPVATNKTAVGRAKNRRIEANLVCEKNGVQQAPAAQSGPTPKAAGKAAAVKKGSALGKKPVALVPAQGNVANGDVPPAQRQGEPEARFFPQAADPGVTASGSALLPAAQRKGEETARYFPNAAAPELKEGAVPPPLPAAKRIQEPPAAYPDQPPEPGQVTARVAPALPAAQLPPQAVPLVEGAQPAPELKAAKEPPELPPAQLSKQAALPTPDTPATSAPTALPSIAAAPAALPLAAVSEAASVASALRKQEPEPVAPDEAPFELKATTPTPVPDGRIALTGITIDKDGLSLYTSGKVNEFNLITMVEPFSLVIDLYGAVNGIGLPKAPVEKFDLTTVRFREFPDHLQITLDAGREEIIPYRSFKTDTGLRINIKPRSSHHIGP
ncbi:OmpA family protein [Geomonas nitrogeniifigens]|uniref:OmpA family protein n=1 Tax=Geomonas diazotrophica TaxID=2843197 RepID=A0ABX8JD90_9BACT|nr:OmpA family protein [Geomonas nitrogeniifigens]QWV96335.1 OmpA family protein [Geomonas nitrogeniifigens]